MSKNNDQLDLKKKRTPVPNLSQYIGRSSGHSVGGQNFRNTHKIQQRRFQRTR